MGSKGLIQYNTRLGSKGVILITPIWSMCYKGIYMALAYVNIQYRTEFGIDHIVCQLRRLRMRPDSFDRATIKASEHVVVGHTLLGNVMTKMY